MSSKVLIVDDDNNQVKLLELYLKKNGYITKGITDSRKVVSTVADFCPDVLVIDLMMPNRDGLSLLKELRDNQAFEGTKVVVISGKSFAFDQKRAIQLGANAFLSKPIKSETLQQTIESLLKEELKVTFWGTRGTVPTPEPKFLGYGGNTSCVSVEVDRERLFVFDAGTGIIKLGNEITSTGRHKKINLFISHPHWDHIQGFPFFVPAYIQGNEIAVHGTSHADLSLREVISGQMESIYFPITISQFAARVYFKEISEGSYEVDGVRIDTIFLNHPGNTLGYRLTCRNKKSVAYITDNELVPREYKNRDRHFHSKLVEFLKGVDILIHDSSYFDEEYKSKVGWGHSPIGEVVRLGAECGAKRLYLTHHDNFHDDNKVKEKEKVAGKLAEELGGEMECHAATEEAFITL